MIRWVSDMLAGLIPNDETDAQSVRIYRLRLALVACSAWLAVCLLVIPALFVGLPIVGRVAWAGELDDKIARSVSPIQRELSELKREIRASTEAMNHALAEAIYQEILQLSRQRCAATEPRERDRLAALIRSRQLRYQALSGDPSYSAPTCADL